MRCFPVLSALLSLLATPTTPADTVKLVGRDEFRNVRISAFHAGKLTFQGVSRQYLRKPIHQIEWIAVDAAPSLTRAEKARGQRDWSRATAAYRDAARRADQRWLRDYAQLRLLVAADRAGRFDLAVETLVTLGPRLGEDLDEYLPRRVKPPGSPQNRRAGILLQRALRADVPTARHALCRRLLLELAIYEEVTPLPRALYESTPTAEPDPADAPDDDEPLGILPPEPSNTGARRAELPALPPDSFMLTALARELDDGNTERVARVVSRAMQYVPRKHRGPWQVLAARAAIARGDHAQAASDLMRVAAHDPDATVAASALYYVAIAHERMDRPDVARRLYRELLDQEAPVPADLAKRARANLERLSE